MADVEQKLEQTSERWMAKVRQHPLAAVAAVGTGALLIAEAIGAAELAVAAALAYGAFRLFRPREARSVTP